MLNDQRISEKELYDPRMKIHHVVKSSLGALPAGIERSNIYPPKMWKTGKKNDMFHLSLPTQYGGMGLCLEQCLAVLEGIEGGNQAIRMSFHVVNGLDWEIMAEHGTEKMKNEYLLKMGTGDFFVAFAPTESNCSSDVDIRSTTVKKGDRWVLNGRKTLVSFTDICDVYYIIAISDEEKRKKGGRTVSCVPADTKGLRMENMPHMTGCRGTGHGDMTMGDMETPNEHRLGAEGEGLTVFLHALAVFRASIGVCLLGLSQRMLELTIARAKDRVTLGKALIQRQAVQQMLADMTTQVHVLRLLVQDYTQRADRGEDIETIPSMMKLHEVDTVRTMSNSCLEIFGRIGYFEDSPYGPVECLYRDARAMWSGEDPRTVQHLTLVRKVIDVDGEIGTSNYC